MKPGTRALGIAESTDQQRGRCVFCGAVVRVDRAVDGFSFSTASVGGLDATDAVCTLVERLDREDVQYLLVSGVAPAWFNLLDLDRIASVTDRPVLSISFEESDGLAPALREQFEGDALAARLQRYERLPHRRRLRINDESVFVRSVGFEDGPSAVSDDPGESDVADAPAEVERVVRAYTPEGGRPEPLRVARLAARAARQWRVADADAATVPPSQSDSDSADRHE